jgi:hypothetical protein
MPDRHGGWADSLVGCALGWLRLDDDYKKSIRLIKWLVALVNAALNPFPGRLGLSRKVLLREWLPLKKRNRLTGVGGLLDLLRHRL